MTLESTVLKNLAEQAGASKRHDVQVSDAESGWTLHLTAERRDDLSCLTWELALRRSQPAGSDLHGWARSVADRTRALTEPLQVNEIDDSRQEAVLRTLPVQRSGQKLYYEVFLQGTSAITLRRFQAPEPGQRREQVAFALTTETLARLVGELTGA